MLITIDNVLNQEDLFAVQTLLDKSTFVSGKKSAGVRAARGKNNTELEIDDASLASLNGIVMGRLVSNKTYGMACLPLRVAAPYYAKYRAGMFYASHIDDPIMGEGQRYRSDISLTIFLNSPADYDGGELVIETEFGEKTCKPAAGSVVIYPSSSLHRVTEVTKGERLVAVSWVQSLIRDTQKRQLLYQLGQARDSLFETSAQQLSTTQVDHSYVNLVRMWSEL
jgi:PKHD-type hydroxylase